MKKRISIPKAVSEAVLKEYHHRCAVCGRHEPQLHHIDQNPSNNDSANLLPLCPNCHLQDTHAPTTPLDPKKIRLFRRCKDPFILDSRFHPLWTRLTYLRIEEKDRIISWEYSCQDFLMFIKSFQMGEYYSTRIKWILNDPLDHFIVHLIQKGESVTKESIASDETRHKEVYEHRASIIEDLCVEMLRYQGWQLSPTKAT